MIARTLAESWDECLIDAVPSDATAEQIAMVHRAFFRGALATVGMPPEQLRAELIGHGRSVGSQAEAAPLKVSARVPGRALELMRRRA